RHRRSHPKSPRHARADRAAGRASHGHGHAGLGEGGGARLRPEDRRGHAGRGATGPQRRPGLSRRGGMSALLEVHGLEAFYGRTKALHGVSFTMMAGGITTILGANGAGKTTTLRAISRMVRTAGAIVFDGAPLERRATEDVVRLGIAHAPEGRGTFVHLTVEENLRLGAWGRRHRAKIEDDFARVFSYFPMLEARRRQPAGTLSGGEQQM